MKPRGFEDMWTDILEVMQNRDFVETLSRKVRNEIVEVEDSRIIVRSEETHNERRLHKETFRPFCTRLLDHGSLDFVSDIQKSKWIGVGAVIVAIISLLPYVEYRTEPRVLFLKE